MIKYDILAKRLLPITLYQRLAGSTIAKRLARGAMWSLAGSAISRVLVLVAMILVARILGQVSFGEFGLVQSTLGVVGLMGGLGLGRTATRFVAQHADADPIRAGRVIALVISVSMGTVLFATGLLVVTSDFIAYSVLESPHLQPTLIWGSLLMVTTAFRGIQNGVFAGLEKFEIIAKLNILDGVMSFAAMIFLSKHMGVNGALLGLALSAMVVWLFGHTLLINQLKKHNIIVRYKGCWADWRILTGYSLPSFLSSLVATPVLWFAMTLVARMEQGYAELGLYNAAYQWHGPMVFIPMTLTSVSLPVLAQEWEAGRRERFRTVAFGICVVTLAVSVPFVLLAALLSPRIMSFYGPGFVEGWMVLVFLLAAAPLHALAKIASAALFGMNKAWWVLGTNVAWGVHLLSVTVWLVPTMGVLGLAIAFLSAYGILGTLTISLVFIGSRLLPEVDRTNCITNKDGVT